MEYILLVDDNQPLAYVVAGVLTEQGYKVLIAANGGEASTLISTEPPKLILLDMRTRDMNSWAFADTQQSRRPSTPILIMTTATNAQQWAAAVGADAYLTKPFGKDELVAEVDRIIGPAAAH